MHTADRWTPARVFALVGGVGYLLVALGGIAITGFDDWTGMGHEKLIVFAVNPLHNMIHLAIALSWLASVRSHRAARVVDVGVGVVLGLVTVAGFFGWLGMLGMHGLADPDNFLHLSTATLALYFGSVGADSTAHEHDELLAGA